MKLLASLASADQLRLADCIDSLAGWPALHFDIEDGNYTPNITFGLKTLHATADYVRPRRLDVHLMVNDPLGYLPILAREGVESVSTHFEALRFPLRFLNEARAQGMRAGLAINIATPFEAVFPFVKQMNFLLCMTAEPDSEGEMLCETALEKACQAARRLPIPVYADGALDANAITVLSRAGVAGCVLGRVLFSSTNPRAVLDELKHQSF